jgi:hypothetical protein
MAAWWPAPWFWRPEMAAQAATGDEAAHGAVLTRSGSPAAVLGEQEVRRTMKGRGARPGTQAWNTGQEHRPGTQALQNTGHMQYRPPPNRSRPHTCCVRLGGAQAGDPGASGYESSMRIHAHPCASMRDSQACPCAATRCGGAGTAGRRGSLSGAELEVRWWQRPGRGDRA